MLTQAHSFPVFATQGGGLVRLIRNQYFFITKPNCPGLNVGDDMPAEWGVVPVNSAAQKLFDECCGTANCGCAHHAEQGIPCEHDFAAAAEKMTAGKS